MALVLSGCLPTPAPVVNTVVRVERCPPAPPIVDCLAFPEVEKPVTIESLLDAFVDARKAHAHCRANSQAWQEEWASCEK
ncbi:MAG: hypothetical protein OXL41_04020 [Nitrospinae bacterium]|nr:hypothetical protein [Nitrospinota bacterium]